MMTLAFELDMEYGLGARFAGARGVVLAGLCVAGLWLGIASQSAPCATT